MNLLVADGCARFLANQAVSTALVHCDGGIFTKWQLLLAALQAAALVQQKRHLLVLAVEGAALLGVDEVVPVACGQHSFSGIASLLLSPIIHPPPLKVFLFFPSAVLLLSVFFDRGGCALTSPQPTA